MEHAKQEADKLDAIIKEAEASFGSLEERAADFAETFTSSLKTAIRTGQEFDDMLRHIGKSLADTALQQALKPVEQLLSRSVQGIAGQLAGNDLPPPIQLPIPGSGGRASAPSINFNVQSGDAAGFMKSGPQIEAMLARLARRGMGLF